jgi:drug/metabolite transporter (DMT)-like permease
MIGFFAITISAVISALQRFRQKDLMMHADNTQMVFYQSLVGAIVFFPFLFINTPMPTIHQSTIAIIFSLLIGIAGFYLYFQ